MMKQNVWIWNHYATNTFKDKAGRHYWFANNLIKSGYKTTIFCASTIHNSNENVDTKGNKYIVGSVNTIPYVFINTSSYYGNGIKRIINMITFYRNLFPVSKEYAEENGKPDVIIASSVHPLTLIAGIKIAKKFNVPCICEIRDLWPESIVIYGALKRDSISAKILYLGEKWIYKKADKLIFTMEGGRDYIIDQGWDKNNGGPIDVGNVFYINNGVDIDEFNGNLIKYNIEDVDLDDKAKFKVIYTGSIRKVNEIEKIIEIAKYLNQEGNNDIKFLIYGDGDDKERLENLCFKDEINNVIFKGKASKRIIPYILSKSNLNILHFKQSKLKKYGASLNKIFEYFASGKPVISDCEFGYDLIYRYQCGIVIDNGSPKQLAEAIVKLSKMSSDVYNELCVNSIIAAQDYDFKILTGKLINIIENA